jgi:hypothetical protein
VGVDEVDVVGVSRMPMYTLVPKGAGAEATVPGAIALAGVEVVVRERAHTRQRSAAGQHAHSPCIWGLTSSCYPGTHGPFGLLSDGALAVARGWRWDMVAERGDAMERVEGSASRRVGAMATGLRRQLQALENPKLVTSG